MRADVIGSLGRTGTVSALSIATSGRLSKLLDLITVIRDFINAFLSGEGAIKIFRAIAEMDRVFTADTEM